MQRMVDAHESRWAPTRHYADFAGISQMLRGIGEHPQFRPGLFVIKVSLKDTF
jgi:hypothetical protein